MSDGAPVQFTSKLWVWQSTSSPGAWHFLTADGEAGDAIAAHEAMRRMELGSGRGFGSVKVEAQIGETSWKTSVFPSKSHGGYLLPVKAAVRKAEGLVEGDEVKASLTLL
ncbi:DUF1905 domain-containing protein [Aurantiacibacter sp. D1-12]|uniref:DUF1905 domain-containing protein n=1 Tax=Aurantiacibacter sp. D1-12 TaxID=2993658 RepID=UPI00237CA7DC|nr:DUF1905 domain-containing protein [Aurantiacibacter sp. D1-12]MDE1467738.1 DUF1905 domain-containing protein [Aurantiacibacter sp. D1-12]